MANQRRVVSYDPKNSPIKKFETACVKKLQQEIRAAQVQDWADFFRNGGQGNQREQLIFGFQNGRPLPGPYNPEEERPSLQERSTFELQVEVFDVGNHGKALALVEFVFYEVLTDFQPFEEIDPLLPESYGNPTFDPSGKWIYSATFTATRNPRNRVLTPKTPPIELKEPLVIKIGLYNDRASPPDAFVGTITAPDINNAYSQGE